MRSILITTAVLAVLVAAFVIFLLSQKSTIPMAKRNKGNPASLPALHDNADSDSSVGGGEGGWVQSFDKKTGELINEFRAEHFDPPVGNQVHVIKPDGRFYDNKNGQVLTLHAEYGDITMAETAKRTDRLGSMQSQPPSNGIMHNVTLGLLETPESTVPILVATLPIVAFDNDTLRLNTVPWPVEGQADVPADKVPVKVRGRDYDFDGEGLTLRYNQRDRRLEFLEVAHGRRLLIKNPKAFGATPGSPLSSAAGMPVMLNGRPLELASTDDDTAPRMSAEERERRRVKREAATRRAAHEAATRAAATQQSKPHEIVAYRATFNEDVHIKEGDAPVGTADRMTATFTSEQGSGASSQPATTQSATQTTAAPAVTPSPTVTPATTPARRTRTTRPAGTVATVQPSSGPAQTAVSQPATSPTSAPAQGPIEITWTGKLTVVPQKLADSGLRSTSDRIVEFTGKPVHLQRNGQTIDAAYVWTGIQGSRFRAAPDKDTPLVTLHDPNGTTLITEAIDADGDDVIMHGQSQADMVMAGDTPPKIMHTTWTKSANIRLADTADGKHAIQRAVLQGNVNVQHPQLKMTSDSLALGFTPVAGKEQPELSAVHADGAVHAAVTNDDGTVQTIVSSTLDLATAVGDNGQLAVHALHAHGDVVASDPKQTLKTDDLNTTLAPAPADAKGGTSSTFNVDQLTAAGNVQFSTVDGTTATADKLSVDRVDTAQWVTLTGTPAKVTDPQSVITGNQIRVDTAGTHATIDGPGTLNGTQKSADGNAGQPVEVVWSQSMHFDGAANTAKILGDVLVTSHGTDGTLNHAKGKVLDIAFADAPTTKPAATDPTTKPAGFAGISGPNKQVKLLTLSTGTDEKVEVSSVLYSVTDPTIWVRRTYLYAPEVVVHTNPDGSPGAMNVPSGGRMLYEDLGQSAPAATTNAAAATKPAATQPAGGHGTVAMEWSKSMNYDPAKQQALLDGDVIVVHRSPGEDPVKMEAPRLIADLSPTTGNAVNSSPAGAQFKKMTADQGAVMHAKGMRIDAARAVYEPGIDRITATGTPRQPVEWYDENGLSKGSFSEMWWNVKTNQPEKVINVSVEMNR